MVMHDSVVEFICQRVSAPRLSEPAPDPAVLEKVFQSAFRAPDHMLLRPWRYLVIEGAARDSLGELFVQSAQQTGEMLDEFKRDKLRAMPLRAPMIIVAILCAQDHPKVPKEEQLLSCGVGLGYMLLSLQALGFGGIWRSGDMAQNPYLMKGLGLDEHESIVGFLYTGTPVGARKPLEALDSEQFVQPWTGQ